MGDPPAKRSMPVKPVKPYKFLSAWFCPYAQRAWIALNHHKIPYEKVEVLVLKRKPGQALREATGYEKHPLVLKHHPSGLVPTLVDADEAEPAVYDSLICVEFCEDLATTGVVQGGTPLLPGDAVQRGRARIWADYVNKQICSQFYKVLVPKDLAVRAEAIEAFRAGLLKFQQEMKGPFFFGAQLSIVDIALFPWAYRAISVGIFETYRGPEFALDSKEFAGVYQWLKACEELEAVKSTLADPQDLKDTYHRYAEGTAESKVAEAVRIGKSAHEHG
mmetsp:Transcript_132357/g.300854  ORF Transcript_132357/g.300854 Transcript_132357/m.300854 type:complete len:276 (+) Transcript_132357:2-829(+)